MHETEAVRRLVKSPPELWAQCSDPLMLARHLSSFGDITITRLEPESTVAWEGESASGTVSLEESGWGTRVRLTATPPSAPASGLSAPVLAPEVPGAGVAVTEPRGLSARLGAFLNRRRTEASAASRSAPAAVRTPARELTREPVTPAVTEPADLAAGLEAALDSLGQAHHRPYSRA